MRIKGTISIDLVVETDGEISNELQKDQAKNQVLGAIYNAVGSAMTKNPVPEGEAKKEQGTLDIEFQNGNKVAATESTDPIRAASSTIPSSPLTTSDLPNSAITSIVATGKQKEQASEVPPVPDAVMVQPDLFLSKALQTGAWIESAVSMEPVLEILGKDVNTRTFENPEVWVRTEMLEAEYKQPHSVTLAVCDRLKVTIKEIRGVCYVPAFCANTVRHEINRETAQKARHDERLQYQGHLYYNVLTKARRCGVSPSQLTIAARHVKDAMFEVTTKKKDCMEKPHYIEASKWAEVVGVFNKARNKEFNKMTKKYGSAVMKTLPVLLSVDSI